MSMSEISSMVESLNKKHLVSNETSVKWSWCSSDEVRTGYQMLRND